MKVWRSRGQLNTTMRARRLRELERRHPASPHHGSNERRERLEGQVSDKGIISWFVHPSLDFWLCVTNCALFAGGALAHPASGIVVNEKGDVFFIHSRRGACKIDTEGKLTYIHKNTGGHFMALDAEGRFASTANNRLFMKIKISGVKPLLLFASGGAPFVVNRDGNLYYGSGFPGGADTAPGGLTLTRMSPDGKLTLFTPGLKEVLEKLNEAVTGLAAGPDGTLFVACPNAILKVKTDGSVRTFVNPVVVKDCEDDLAKESRAPFFHSPYLRGLDVAENGTVYAAVTGCRCVVKIAPEGKVETLLKSERPWSPTGVALHGEDLFVLEYTNVDKSEGWNPRVRKLGRDGRVSILVTLDVP